MMKHIVLALSILVLVSCRSTDNMESLRADQKNIETTIRQLYSSMKEAYTSGGMDTDSLLNAYYDSTSYYVTPWGTTEIMDSTKARLRSALSVVTDFEYSIESLSIKSYGDGATAFFVFRQDYMIDGKERSEYLPTTMILERRGAGWKIIHTHRSADPETWSQWFGQL